jgi:hypothetical protein
VVAPLKEHERREVERTVPLIQDAQGRRAVLDKSKQRSIDNAAKALDPSSLGIARCTAAASTATLFFS